MYERLMHYSAVDPARKRILNFGCSNRKFFFSVDEKSCISLGLLESTDNRDFSKMVKL
jgi:hypothetical protein